MSAPVFPEFAWDEFFWVTSVKLPSWQGFQIRNGPYGALSSGEKSSGVHKIVFAPEGRDETPLTEEEIELVAWVVAHEKAIHDAVLDELFAAYPAAKAAYIDEMPEDAPPLPEVTRAEDMKALVGVVAITVHQVSRDGMPYVGVELGCEWDEEHGAGILLHGMTPIEIGGADTAILLWMAEEHAEGA